MDTLAGQLTHLQKQYIKRKTKSKDLMAPLLEAIFLNMHCYLWADNFDSL